MALSLAFVMDPLERIDVHADTSFAFMLAAQQRGHRVIHVSPADLELQQERLFVHGTRVKLFARPGDHFQVVERVHLAATDFDAIFLRSDPPVDKDYITSTWLLSFAERQGVWVINSPQGIREANEKLFALEFPDLCPPTLISNSIGEITAFMEKVDGEAIAKPIDGHAGEGVFRLRRGDTNVRALIDALTAEGRRGILVQSFLPDRRDKRLIFINGKLRGALVRIPADDDHRANVHVGGRAVACDITDTDRVFEAVMGDKMRERGLFFVGVDAIGSRLIEVNVTSPTLVQELKQLGGPDLALEVIEAVEAHANEA